MVSEYSSTPLVELCGQKSNQPSDRHLLKTRNEWRELRRSVKPNEKSPAGYLRFRQQRKLESCDHVYEIESEPIALFHFSQTRPARKTRLNEARWKFFKAFVDIADRNRSLRWCTGDYETDEDGEHVFDDDGKPLWDSTIDKAGWRYSTRRLGLAQAEAHEMGKERFGAFGAESSFHLTIDLDLHNQPKELFLNRFRVLLDAFHGRHRCHFQVSDQRAGGVHFILFFGRASGLISRRRWLLNQLAELDERHGGVNLTKVGKAGLEFNVEVYPDQKNGCRLPLCSDRTMLLDKPLSLVERGKSKAQDVIGYVDWLGDPSRSFMPKEDVETYVRERLDWSCSSDVAPNSSTDSEHQSAGKPVHSQCAAGRVSLRGTTKRNLIRFWRDGDAEGFRHLNAAILVTLRCLHAEGLSKDDSVETVARFVEELPTDDISSRQVSGVAKIHAEIVRCAEKVWDAPAIQKLIASVEHWRSYGFFLSDKSTWNAKQRKQTVIDCCEIDFTAGERQLLITHMAPLLVGAKQALKLEKQAEVIRAVAHFLRLVKCHEGEIDCRFLPKILENFDLKLGNTKKQCDFFALLKEWEWIDVVQQPIAGKFTRDKIGKATVYSIGSAITAKFSGA